MRQVTLAALRAAIVTGAGTGIGAAVARRLGADGYAVTLVGRRAKPLEAFAGELEEAAVVPADIGAADEAERVVAATVERFGGVDLLVNNAGVGDSSAVLEETPERWDETLRINLTGAFLMARAALPQLIERRGSIVNVSSINGLVAGQAGPRTASRRRGSSC